MSTVGHISLSNAFMSIQYDNPELGEEIRSDIYTVAINALSEDKTTGKAAAARLRQAATRMPAIQERILCNALLDLGY